MALTGSARPIRTEATWRSGYAPDCNPFTPVRFRAWPPLSSFSEFVAEMIAGSACASALRFGPVLPCSRFRLLLTPAAKPDLEAPPDPADAPGIYPTAPAGRAESSRTEHGRTPACRQTPASTQAVIRTGFDPGADRSFGQA